MYEVWGSEHDFLTRRETPASKTLSGDLSSFLSGPSTVLRLVATSNAE
ncbi:hypothetical protein ACPOL_5830 [Acidisarcina polymorpha]|uniref:Uncharacterized protein n=1 Tax=Acidisarcina polymorpha TaxID=2211140 RepID=A0A2Z5G8Q5_9BACT|nr:hypothetical protein ACPOL_5830 [Acidisarcina polymorpha]